VRYPILVSPLWRPFLLPFGGSRERSYVELENGTLRVRFGWLFDHSFPVEEVEGASPSHWPVWAGIGWRTNLSGTVGLVGTYVNVVELRFKVPQRVRMLLPTRCQRLYVSLEEPRDFMTALLDAGHHTMAKPAAPARRSSAKPPPRPATKPAARRNTAKAATNRRSKRS
jgi:hypothetical protein